MHNYLMNLLQSSENIPNEQNSITNGSITDWLMVIITLVYVVATIFICFANIQSAKSSKEQTKEMQRQFFAVNRPNISVEVVYIKKKFWALRFTNNGVQTAFNAKIVLDEKFISSTEEQVQPILRKNNGRVRTLGVNQSYDLYFGTNEYRELTPKANIKGQITYKGCNDSIYLEDFEIETENYATFFSVKSEMEEFLEKIAEQNKELKNIRHTLEGIEQNTNPNESSDVSNE